DEHFFMFPEAYSKEDVQDFLLRLQKKLIDAGSGYQVYDFSAIDLSEDQIAEIKEIAKKVTNNRALFDEEAGLLRVAVDKKAEKAFRDQIAVMIGQKSAEDARLTVPAFIMPAAAVRATGNSLAQVNGADMLSAAERGAGKKWDSVLDLDKGSLARRLGVDSVSGLADVALSEREGAKEARAELERIWGQTKGERRAAMLEIAAENARDTGEDVSFEGADGFLNVMKYGMSGFNNRIVVVTDHDFSKVEAEQSQTVLKKIGELKARREKVKEATNRSVQKFLNRARQRTGREYAAADAYTSYNADIFHDLLVEVLSMNPEDIKALDAEDRVLMVRGPPADFFTILLNEDGTVNIMNIDMMCHAHTNALTEKGKKKDLDQTLDLLKKGLGGRETDYAILEGTEKEVRMFPFKALNSYIGSHDMADDYILAASVGVHEAFVEAMRKAKGAISNAEIAAALKNAAEVANAEINTEAFEKQVKKKRINIAFEGHLTTDWGISVDIKDKDKANEVMAEKLIRRLSAMGAVRKKGMVDVDGEVIANEEGELAARLRSFITGAELDTNAALRDKVETFLSKYSAEVGTAIVDVQDAYAMQYKAFKRAAAERGRIEMEQKGRLA
ncbi:MAG: hypothetical protein WBD00_05600, partial [Candidatus Omnitrophota bacterium]